MVGEKGREGLGASHAGAHRHERTSNYQINCGCHHLRDVRSGRSMQRNPTSLDSSRARLVCGGG